MDVTSSCCFQAHTLSDPHARTCTQNFSTIMSLAQKTLTTMAPVNKKKGKGSFYIAQYPVRSQSALHFLPSLTDLFIPTPTLLLREAFYSHAAITRND